MKQPCIPDGVWGFFFMKKKLTNDDYNWIDDNREELKKAENKWRGDIAKTQTDGYLIDAFPQEKELVMQKLREYWEEASILYTRLKKIRNITDHLQLDTFSKWFYLKWEKYKEGKKLKMLQEQIRRLERLKIAYEKKEIEKHLSKEYFKTIKERERFDIDRMFATENLLVDILTFNGIALKQNGVIFNSLCPFHNEKTPSFFIYRNNWYHCYGCQAHGNFLDFLMRYKNITFREALEEANRFL